MNMKDFAMYVALGILVAAVGVPVLGALHPGETVESMIPLLTAIGAITGSCWGVYSHQAN